MNTIVTFHQALSSYFSFSHSCRGTDLGYISIPFSGVINQTAASTSITPMGKLKPIGFLLNPTDRCSLEIKEADGFSTWVSTSYCHEKKTHCQ